MDKENLFNNQDLGSFIGYHFILLFIRLMFDLKGAIARKNSKLGTLG